MCRSKEAGGRRCPAHSTPEYRARENARRRAVYAAKKQGTLSYPASLNKRLTGHRSVHETGTTISGIIHMEELETHPDPFGFDEARQYFDNLYEDLRNQQTAESAKNLNKSLDFYAKNLAVSAERTATLTSDERLAVNIYTSEIFNKIHKYLIYNKLPADVVNDFDWKNVSYRHYNNLEEVLEDIKNYYITNEQGFNMIIRHIDSALKKARTGKQQVVYRGLPMKNSLIQIPYEYQNQREDESNEDYHTRLGQYVAKNVKIGQELVFDSYMSGTYDKNIASTFVNAALVEILTPNGANIQSISTYEAEKEVMLPRNQRYKIVGVKFIEPPKDELVARLTGGMKTHLKPIIQMVAINDKGEILDGTNG